MSEHNLEQSNHSVDDEYEKIKSPLVVSLLVLAVVIFLMTLSGFTDGFSEWTTETLIERLGYTTEWSVTYGPEWFNELNVDISALGGAVFLTIAVGTITGFYYKSKDKRRMWRFLIIIIGGLLFMLLMKTVFAQELPSGVSENYVKSVTTFPSGHAMMATIFYLTAAIYLTRKYRGKKIRQYYIMVASFIIIIIGISRVFGANHTVTEVIAGWSLGLIWLCFCWLFERFARIKGW